LELEKPESPTTTDPSAETALAVDVVSPGGKSSNCAVAPVHRTARRGEDGKSADPTATEPSVERPLTNADEAPPGLSSKETDPPTLQMAGKAVPAGLDEPPMTEPSADTAYATSRGMPTAASPDGSVHENPCDMLLLSQFPQTRPPFAETPKAYPWV
jgi:hypothetical protein